MYVNEVTLVGYLGADPELKQVRDTDLVNIRIAIADPRDARKDKPGMWVSCFGFGKTAEFIDRFFKKGDRIFIHGALVEEQWETREGQKRTQHKVKINNAGFIDKQEHMNNGSNREDRGDRRDRMDRDYDRVSDRDDRSRDDRNRYADERGRGGRDRDDVPDRDDRGSRREDRSSRRSDDFDDEIPF